jgi:hypothetical protein
LFISWAVIDWLGGGKPLSHKEIVKRKIDGILPLCATFEDFLAKLKAEEYEVNAKRKHVSVKAPVAAQWKNLICVSIDIHSGNSIIISDSSKIFRVKVK